MEVWVSSKSLPSFPPADAHGWRCLNFTHTPTLYPALEAPSSIDCYSLESLYANGDKSEPHVRPWSPAKLSGAGCTANVGMRTPFFFLPPFLLQSVWTTPKQEVHFLFFLKKDLAASVFSPKLTCATHYPLTLVYTRTVLKPFSRVREFKRNYSSVIKLYKDIFIWRYFKNTRTGTADSI